MLLNWTDWGERLILRVQLKSFSPLPGFTIIEEKK